MRKKFAGESGIMLSDAIAGATLAVVKVPQAMASAVLASVNPVAGVYTLIVSMPVGALLSSSVLMNVSTTGALAIAAGEALYTIPDEEKIGALMLLVLLMGAFQLGLGLLGVGRLTRFISNSVMTGFMLGIAALIVLTSIRDITGFESNQAFHILRLAETALNWRLLDALAVIIGIATICVVLLLDQTRWGKFAPVLALGLATLLGFGLERILPGLAVTRIADVAYIASSPTMLQIPALDRLPDLILPAFSIAIIGMAQTTGVNQSFPNPDGRFPDVSRDFVALGAANMASSAFGAIPAGGSLSGTTVLVRSGARSRWANVFSAVCVLAIALLLLDVVAMIPMAALGGLLFVIGLQNVQLSKVREVWTTGFVSRAALCGTALATLLFPLHIAILTGVSLSFALQVLHLANRIEIRQWQLVDGGFPVDLPAPEVLKANDVSVIYIKGVLFFASAQSIEEKLPRPSHRGPSVLVLVLQDTEELGSTVIRSLITYARTLHAAGNRLMLAGVNASLLEQLERTSFFQTVRREDVYAQRTDLGACINDAVLDARNWVETRLGERP